MVIDTWETIWMRFEISLKQAQHVHMVHTYDTSEPS